MNFTILDEAIKQTYHDRLLECADSYGGVNFFLQLIEALRATKPHPLIEKNCNFYFSLGGIKWNKVIFKDKLTLLLIARSNESKNGNLLPSPNDKSYKSVMNLVRTLKPIKFVVKPKNSKDGEGFILQPFEIIDEKVTRLNPLFDALFFSSIDTVRQVLTYKPSNEPLK